MFCNFFRIWYNTWYNQLWSDNLKKPLSILAISLACSNWSRLSPRRNTPFTANWTADGRYQEQTEILEYTVTHKKESIRFPSENGSVYGGTENENCEITYGPGTYTVTMETSPSLPAGVEDPRGPGLLRAHLPRAHRA